MDFTKRGFAAIPLLVALVVLLGGGAAYLWLKTHHTPAAIDLSGFSPATTTAQAGQQGSTGDQNSTEVVTPQTTGTQAGMSDEFSTEPPSDGFACPYQVKNGKEYWGVREMPEVDISSFENVSVYRDGNSFCMGKDKNAIYVDEKAVPNSDPSQFAILPPNGTKVCQYFIRVQGAGVFGGVWRIAGADPNTFVDITSPVDHDSPNGGTCYAKDNTQVYIDSGVPQSIAGADPNTFVVLNSHYTKDATHAWYWGGLYDNGGPISGADGSTFVALSIEYAKDASHVFHTNKTLEGADPGTFVALPYGFAKDATHVYDGSTVLTNIDPRTVAILDDSYLKDRNGVYATPFLDGFDYQSTPIPQADSVTFSALGFGYGKDDNAVYWVDYNHKPTVVVGADPATFIVANSGYGKDSNHIYTMGKILADADVSTFKEIPGGRYVSYYTDGKHVWYAGGMGTGSIVLIPGADPYTFVLTDQDGGAKDANHTYGFDAKGRFYTVN